MNRQSPRHPLAVLLLLAIAACGADAGSPAAGSDPADPPPAAESEDPAGGPPTDDSAPTDGEDELEGLAELPEGTPAACDVLTVDEVASVLGHPVEPRDTAGPGHCSWWPEDPENGLFASLTLVPLDQQHCIDSHVALGASELFEYEDVDFGVPGFAQYKETLSETFVATFELCTEQINAGVRVEGQEADEEAHMGMAAELVPLVLDRIGQ